MLTVLSTSTLYAQIPEYYETSVVNFTPQFFVCLLAGILLAMGFQVLLTTLSVASGISAIGNIEGKAGSNRQKNKNNDKDHDHDDETSTAVTISSAVGIWTIITVSISLFFASLLAVKLSLLSDNTIGMTLGLVIWAAFFSIIMYLEVKSVSSLLGSIVNTALSGIRSTFNTVGGVFGKSKEATMKSIADDSIHSIREEIADAMDNSRVSKKIDAYVTRLEPQELDYQKIKNELKDLLLDIRLEERTEMGDEGMERRTFIQLADNQPKFSKKDVKKLGNIYDEIKRLANSEGSNADKVITAVDRFTPGSEEDTKKYRSKLEAYLRATGKEELNPDNLKRDLENIFNDPSQSRDIIRNRINQLDRNTLVTVISQREDFSEEDARKITSYFDKAFDFVKSRFSGNGGGQDNQRGKNYGASDQGYAVRTEGDKSLRDVDLEISKKDDGNEGGASGFERKIQAYFDSLDRPEFDYEMIKRDFQHIFHDPKSTFDVLKNHLSKYDRASLIALLSSRDNISRKHAERMVAKVEEARDTVIQKAEQVEYEVKSKVRQLKDAALQEAENARKAAATAAWWLFATAVVSGAASAVGGMLAIAM